MKFNHCVQFQASRWVRGCVHSYPPPPPRYKIWPLRSRWAKPFLSKNGISFNHYIYQPHNDHVFWERNKYMLCYARHFYDWRDKTTILYCSTFCVHFDGSWPNLKTFPPTNTVSGKYEICRGYNIWSEDQHRLTTKNIFFLELKRNRQFYRQSVFRRPLSQTATTMKKLLH
jgi:hypothetical protein